MESILLISGLAIGLLIAGVTDVREGRIPNWLTFSLAGFGMAVHGWHQGFSGLLLSVEGLAIGILCLIFFYIKGGMGAGDVKLLGAIGAILGPHLIIYAFGFAGALDKPRSIFFSQECSFLHFNLPAWFVQSTGIAFAMESTPQNGSFWKEPL